MSSRQLFPRERFLTNSHQLLTKMNVLPPQLPSESTQRSPPSHSPQKLPQSPAPNSPQHEIPLSEEPPQSPPGPKSPEKSPPQQEIPLSEAPPSPKSPEKSPPPLQSSPAPHSPDRTIKWVKNKKSAYAVGDR